MSLLRLGRIVASKKVALSRSEQKMVPFRTHYLTKELAYVRTRQSGQVTMYTKMISKKCVELA